MLMPETARTFQEYIDVVFKPFITKQLESANRVDIVWDVYRQDSLKNTRGKRGSRQRWKVLPSTHIPSNWRSFLWLDENKTKLFHLLAQHIVSLPLEEGKETYSLCDERVLTSAAKSDMSLLEPCSHEEADTRIMVHVLDACMSGHNREFFMKLDLLVFS